MRRLIDNGGASATQLRPEAVPPVVLEKADPEAVETTAAKRTEPTSSPSRRAGSGVPLWVLGVLALLSVVALALAGIFWTQHRSYGQQSDAGQEASAAAERALPVVLSYDYRHLTADRDHAARFLTPKYKKEYTATFDKLIESTGSTPGPAEQTKAVVKATVQDVGVVDSEPELAKVIVFLDQATSKASGTPKYSLNRLTVSMVKSGNTWLVDNINSY